MRERRFTGIYYQFAMLIGENLDEKDGYVRRKVHFWCTSRAGCGRKSIIGPRSGNTVNYPRVEKSAFQEICGNSGFSTGEGRVLVGAVTVRNFD